MITQDLLQKPLISATLGDFVEVLKMNAPQAEQPKRNLIKGINGLALAVNVSAPTIQTWKNKGLLNGCYSQQGRSIIFDLDAVYESLRLNRTSAIDRLAVRLKTPQNG